MATVLPKSFEHNLIFRVSALFGLFPFEKGPTFGLDTLLFVYSFAITVAMTIAGGISVVKYITLHPTKSFNQTIFIVYICFLILVFSFNLSCVYLKRDVVEKIFQAIKGMQSIFETMRLFEFNNRTHLLPFLDILVPILCSFLVYLTFPDLFHAEYSIFLGLSFIGVSLICGQFNFLNNLIGDIFDTGIDFLNEMKLSLIIRRHSRRIFDVVKFMNQLGSLTCSLNDVYSLQILVIMSLCFVGFLIHLYLLFVFATLFQFKPLLCQIYIVLFYFYVSWRFNQCCAEISEKWKEFNTVLYQLMIDDKTDEIFNNDKLRMHILMKRELVFNACGFFNLDNSLVHSMIASATTYLVILIQFGRPEIIAR
ncbi:Gustatory receptor 68d [Halyomorpha halys]|nr:Gustatory receptor 68c [Halyomorpha halys]KAE8573214.1 Gustatory receptor 68d [Halyomorpha halys]